MFLLMLILVIFAAGAVGGAVNALLSENGFLMPKWEMAGKNKIFRLGFLGNVFISGVGACISWGLYGPFAAVDLFGKAEQDLGLTLSALVGALLVGVAGARWVTNEVDKLMLRAAASHAAKTPENHDMAAQIESASPAEALWICQNPGETLAAEPKKAEKTLRIFKKPAEALQAFRQRKPRKGLRKNTDELVPVLN